MLYKYCLNHKDIKSVLQFIFSVYNYIKDLRNTSSAKKSQKARQSSNGDQVTLSNKKSSLLSSAEPKKVPNNLHTPVKSQNRSSFKPQHKLRTHKLKDNKNANNMHQRRPKNFQKSRISNPGNHGNNAHELKQRKERILQMTKLQEEKASAPTYDLAKIVADSLVIDTEKSGRFSDITRNQSMVNNDQLYHLSSQSFKGMNKSINPVVQHQNRKAYIQGRTSHDLDDFSFDERSFREIDTTELMKRRQENEAYLEEIERSIMDNIQSTRTIISKCASASEICEDRPLSMRQSCLLKKNNAANPPDIKDINYFDESSVKVKRSHLKNEANIRSKLSNQKAKNRNHADSLGNKRYELDYVSFNSCDIKETDQDTPNTPTIQTEVSIRRMESINKNKAFQEDIQTEGKEMVRAISHVSFTNQTDMFDNYDSQNSTMNDALGGDSLMHNFYELEDANVPQEEDLTSIKNSFLNLKTSKNKFFEIEDTNRAAFDNFTNNTITEILINDRIQVSENHSVASSTPKTSVLGQKENFLQKLDSNNTRNIIPDQNTIESSRSQSMSFIIYSLEEPKQSYKKWLSNIEN